MKSEYALIENILHGDLKAYQELIEKYQKLVAHIVYRLLSSRDDYEDICQEVFIKVYQNLSKFKQESKLSTWIGRIAYNTAVNYLRKEKVPLYEDLKREETGEGHDITERINTEKRDEDATPHQQLETKDRADLVRRLIENLAAPYRTVITLYHLDQLSYQEIAVMMDLPEGTVKSYLFRGRQKLKQSLMKELQGEEI